MGGHKFHVESVGQDLLPAENQSLILHRSQLKISLMIGLGCQAFYPIDLATDLHRYIGILLGALATTSIAPDAMSIIIRNRSGYFCLCEILAIPIGFGGCHKILVHRIGLIERFAVQTCSLALG